MVNTMNPSQIYIAISILVLAIIALLVFFKTKKEKKLTPIAGLAFGFILAGIIFGDNRLIGYILIGIGVILAIIDIIKKVKYR